MRESEQTVNEVVSAICRAGQALSEGRAALMRVAGWSSLTTKLEITEWHARDGNRLAFYGHLDGRRAGVGHVGWILDVTRDGDGWLVERSLNVNRNQSDLNELVAELPARSCRDSSELARTLVTLVHELLALAAPEP